MAQLGKEYMDFFMELAPNNNKDWFDANRNRYHKHVKSPFENLVNELIERLRPLDKEIPEDLSHKHCIFRINRDIRFSKDKTPYKLNRSAVIGPNGKKDHGYPSLYFEAGPEHVRIYTGVYMPDSSTIERIRYYLLNHHEELAQIIKSEPFASSYGPVYGEQYKVLPKKYKALAEAFPLARNKQWYVYKTYDPEVAVEQDLAELIVSDFKVIWPFQEFFRKAVRAEAPRA